MGSVVLWVNKDNFGKFVRGQEFTAWTDESANERFQIIVPSSAVMTLEEKEYEGIEVKCYERRLWDILKKSYDLDK